MNSRRSIPLTLSVFRLRFRGKPNTTTNRNHNDSEKLSHCELLAVDEAAAIPLPLVKKLLGPYLVFLSSTVNGYEGTGRALSLKLIDQLRKQQGMLYVFLGYCR